MRRSRPLAERYLVEGSLLVDALEGLIDEEGLVCGNRSDCQNFGDQGLILGVVLLGLVSSYLLNQYECFIVSMVAYQSI